MAKTGKKSSEGVSVEIVKPKRIDVELKPKEVVFKSGPIEIHVSFKFNKDEFFEMFKNRRLAKGETIDILWDKYQNWRAKHAK